MKMDKCDPKAPLIVNLRSEKQRSSMDRCFFKGGMTVFGTFLPIADPPNDGRFQG